MDGSERSKRNKVPIGISPMQLVSEKNGELKDEMARKKKKTKFGMQEAGARWLGSRGIILLVAMIELKVG